jgi:hypothetical protein
LTNLDFSGEWWASALSFMIVDVDKANCHWHFLRVWEQCLCFQTKAILSDGWVIRLWFQSSLRDWCCAHGSTLKYAYVDISLSREQHNFFLLPWNILDCRSDKLWGKS